MEVALLLERAPSSGQWSIPVVARGARRVIRRSRCGVGWCFWVVVHWLLIQNKLAALTQCTITLCIL